MAVQRRCYPGVTGATYTPTGTEGEGDASADRVYSVVAQVTTAGGVVVNVVSGEVTVRVVAIAADVDTTALKAAVDAAEALNRGGYTAELWQAFQKALATARQQLVNPEGAQTVADALDALTQAQQALVKADGTPNPGDTNGGDNDAANASGGTISGTNGSALSQAGDNVSVAPLAAAGLFGGLIAAVAAFFTCRKRQQ